MPRRFFQLSAPSVSMHSLIIMLLGSIVILLQLGYIAFDIFSGSVMERFDEIRLYRACIEYIWIEVVLLVGGAFLFDVVIKDMETAR